MIQYWVLFFIPFSAILLPIRFDKSTKNISFLFFLSVSSLLIGLRYRVGGDWYAYIVMLKSVENVDFFPLLSLSDPSYYVLNWISVKLNLGIFGVNFVGGLILVCGILAFCRKQPMPFLGLMVAVPYIIIVVGMGYSRQAIALGFVLFAFSSWPKKRFVEFTLFLVIASTFHKAAFVLLPLALFVNRKNIKYKILFGTPFLFILGSYYLWGFFGSSAFEAYFINSYYDSRGAFIRIIMSVIPACIFLLYKNRFKRFGDADLWYFVSIAVFFCLFASFFLSTVADRLALFLSPIQIMVYSRLPVIFKDMASLTFIVLNILILYFLSLFVWLNYAFHSYAWLPYNSVFNM